MITPKRVSDVGIGLVIGGAATLLTGVCWVAVMLVFGDAPVPSTFAVKLLPASLLLFCPGCIAVMVGLVWEERR